MAVRIGKEMEKRKNKAVKINRKGKDKKVC